MKSPYVDHMTQFWLMSPKWKSTGDFWDCFAFLMYVPLLFSFLLLPGTGGWRWSSHLVTLKGYTPLKMGKGKSSLSERLGIFYWLQRLHLGPMIRNFKEDDVKSIEGRSYSN